MLDSGLHSLDLGLDIVVFVDKKSGLHRRYDPLAKVEVIPVFEHGETSFKGVLDELGRVDGVDILHIQHEYGIFGRHNGLINMVHEALEEKLVDKVVITMHTVKHPLSGEEKALEFQRNLNVFDKIVVHSVLQEFELIYQGIDPNKVVRIPHGTFLNPYLWKPRYMLAEELGLKPSDLQGFVITVPGFLRRDKGLDILIKAVKPLLNSMRDYTVVVAGEIRDPELKDEIEEMVMNGPNLVFIERFLTHDEVLKIVALADAVILPYRDRIGTYSVSGILHLSMGGLKPIIGSRVPRLIELYTRAPRLTIPPRNPFELTRKIKWLRENYDVVIPYMSTLYSYAIRTEWHRMARRHLALYSTLYGG